MTELPWLVAYGEWVWRSALGLALLLGIAWPWVALRRRARKGWRRALTDLGPASTSESARSGEEVTVRGTVEAAETVSRLDDGAPAAVSTCVPAGLDGSLALATIRAPRLALRTDRGVVRLDDRVYVERGSEEYWPGKTLSSLREPVRRRVHEASGESASVGVEPPSAKVRFASLRAGDSVVARGRAQIGASVEERDYRESAHESVLEAAALTSDAPPRVRGPSGALAFFVAPAVAAGVFAALFALAGSLVKSASEDVRTGPEAAELEETFEAHGATQWLFAMPFHGEDAALRILRSLGRHTEPTPERNEAMLALAERTEECAWVLQAMEQDRDYEEVLDLASDCDEPRAPIMAARAALALGKPGEAGGLLDDGFEDLGSSRDRELAIRSHLLGGDLASAGETAMKNAAYLRSDRDWREDDENARRHRAESSENYECLAHALKARAGEAGADSALRELAEEYGHLACELLAADLASGKERIELLRGVRADHTRWLSRIPALLRAEADPEAHAGELAVDARLWVHSVVPRGFAVGQRVDLWWNAPGLRRSLLEELRDLELEGEARHVLAWLAAEAAAEASVVLEHDRARELTEVAKESAPSGIRAYAVMLEAYIEFRAGDLDAASEIAQTEVEHAHADDDEDSGEVTAAEASQQEELLALIEGIRSAELPESFSLTVLSRDAVSAGLAGERERFEEDLREHHHQSVPLVKLQYLARWLSPEPIRDHVRESAYRNPFDVWVSQRVPEELVAKAAIADAIGNEDLKHGERSHEELARFYFNAGLKRETAVPHAVLEEL